MMTSRQHREEAERLLAEADTMNHGVRFRELVALANVHATLSVIRDPEKPRAH